MAQIQTITLLNTVDFWRLRTNEVITRINQFAVNESRLYANTIIANNVLKALGNTVLGASNKKTIVNGFTTANGRFIITSNLNVQGNSFFGAAGKNTTITGTLASNGNITVSKNLTVSGNTSIVGLKANNSLGSAGQVLKTNGTSVYWDTQSSSSANLSGYLQVANAVATYVTKINPTTSALWAHTGRATISTNLFVSGNTNTNRLTVSVALISSAATKLQDAIINGNAQANGVLTVNKRLYSSGNNVFGASGKTNILNARTSANGYMSVSARFDVSGNTNLGAAGKKTVVNGFLQANGRVDINTNLSVSGNTSSNKLNVTNWLKSSGNTFIGAAGKTSVVTGVLQANGRATVSTNLTVTGNTSSNKLSVTSNIDGTNANTRVLALGVGAAPGTNGSIRATNDITAYYSDERLKIKLGPIENPIEKVKLLSGFYFEANELARTLGYNRKREVGVSAQEVQAVLPEIVVPAPIDEQYLTVKYEKLIPLLIEAIKELNARVEELESR